MVMSSGGKYTAAMPEPLYHDQWDKIHHWLTENHIRWYAMGNKTIGFDDSEHLMLFMLRWT
jgi:hypothetical protein